MRRESQPPKQKYISTRTTRSAARAKVSSAMGSLVRKVTAREKVNRKIKHLDEDAHPINSVLNRRSERDTKKTSMTTAVEK
ncbi:uncharacterized protein EAF02_010504 [Botrytis sinoallii]|uniref:uncharacterized protein n=1 Tax=Botrytis sinoallii TaxID=1463999 RepID=UPI0019028C2A|nr:uncharacterized protein EAF02_010504 [Botrytis sinoallii]KAF7862955.1 hypothetical protein EAF02_010504 [Botrytis sinoallii]